jgi:hypothetical protein
LKRFGLRWEMIKLPSSAFNFSIPQGVRHISGVQEVRLNILADRIVTARERSKTT